LHDTSLDKHRGNSGRIRTGREYELEDPKRTAIESGNRYKKTQDKLSAEAIAIPRSTLNRIIRLDLRWHPYSMRRRHD